MLYNRLCFDSWFSIGYNHLSLAYFQEGLSRGFMGFQWPNLSVLYYMTLHPTVGLFWQSPVLLLTLLGAAVALRQRRYRAEALVALASILSLLLLLSGYFCWWGGNSLGPRYIIPMLPFFCVLLAFVPRRSTWLLALLCLLSFGQMLIGAASSVLTPGEMVSKIQSLGYFEYSHIYSHSLKLLQSGRFASNLGMRLLGLHGWLSLAPLLAAIALVSGWFYFSCAIEETEPLSG